MFRKNWEFGRGGGGGGGVGVGVVGLFVGLIIVLVITWFAVRPVPAIPLVVGVVTEVGSVDKVLVLLNELPSPESGPPKEAEVRLLLVPEPLVPVPPPVSPEPVPPPELPLPDPEVPPAAVCVPLFVSFWPVRPLPIWPMNCCRSCWVIVNGWVGGRPRNTEVPCMLCKCTVE